MMNVFVSHKKVTATPMNRLDYNIYRGWELPDDEDGVDHGYLVEYLDGGKSNHPDHNGYISWSPKAQFDNSYTEFTDPELVTSNLTFGEAVQFAKEGKRVARTGWSGAKMHAVIMPGYEHGVAANKATADLHGIEVGSNIVINPYWALKTANGSISTWAPSGSDSLAEDWMVID